MDPSPYAGRCNGICFVTGTVIICPKSISFQTWTHLTMHNRTGYTGVSGYTGATGNSGQTGITGGSGVTGATGVSRTCKQDT